MNGYAVGSLIAIERKKKNISQTKLAKGLCSFQLIAKIENNECDTDKLLMDILFQRLGKCPDKLECILSREEYAKIRVRDMIEELILKGKAGKADYLLENYFKYFKEEDATQLMYYHRTKAYLYIRCSNDVLLAEENIKKAVDITLPNWEQTDLSEYLISTYEMENLLAYAKILYLKGDIEEAENVLERCFSYIQEHFTDKEEKNKIFAKCIWLISIVNQKEEDDLRVIQLCEEALKMLREYAVSYFMLPVMKELIKRYEKIGASNKVAYWKQFEQVLEELYQEYAPDMCLDSLFFNCYQCEYHLDYEIIHNERVNQGMTQENLIDGVYKSFVSLSNLENGKSSPNKKSFEGLMKNLGFEKSRYNGLVVVNSFEVLELFSEMNRVLSRMVKEQMQILFERLKERLNCEIPENKRIIRVYELQIAQVYNEITLKELIKNAKECLEETYHIKESCNWRVPLSHENTIINIICISLAKQGKLNEAVSLYKKTLEAYENSKVKPKFHFRTYSLINANLASRLISHGDYETAYKIAKRGIKFELKSGKGNLLRIFIRNIATIEMDSHPEAYSRKKLQSAYVMAELFHNNKAMEAILNFYKVKFGKSLF